MKEIIEENINNNELLQEGPETVKGEVIIPQQQEVVTTSSNGLKFKEVDFDNPSTMLTYGDEAKDAITAILENTAKLADDRAELQIDQEDLKSLTNFDETLDESEEANFVSQSLFAGGESFSGCTGKDWWGMVYSYFIIIYLKIY